VNIKKIQIGICGSAIDEGYTFGEAPKKIAREIGEQIAKRGAVLVHGAEKFNDSLSTISARALLEKGGICMGITHGAGDKLWGDYEPTVRVATGSNFGGGREFVFIQSCDVVIALCGGAGTLMEMAMAYHDRIPIVVVEGLGGWSGKMAGQYFDDRKKCRVEVAKNGAEAVDLAIKLAKEAMNGKK